MSVNSTADRIEKLAESLCCDVERHRAQTGTVYLRIERRDVRLTIRIADHSDAYGTSDYTADDCEGSATGARAYLLERIGATERHVRRLQRMRRSAARRKSASQRMEWIANALRFGWSAEEAAAECPFR